MGNPFAKLTRYHLNTDEPTDQSSIENCKAIIVSAPLDQEERSFLNKVMGSIKVSDSEYGLVTLQKKSRIQLTKSLDLTGKVLIVFGFSPTELGLSLSHVPYKVFHLYTFSCVFIDDLASISASNRQKKHLWEALKELFLTDDD